MECEKQMGASQLLLHPPGNAVRQMVHIGITDRPKPGSRAEPGFWYGRVARLFGSGCKSLFQIGKNIVDMLGADGQADGVGHDALIQQLLGSQLGVGGGCGMNHQGLHIGNIGKQREDFQIVDELVRLLLAALN